jgi:hypothetical protein
MSRKVKALRLYGERFEIEQGGASSGTSYKGLKSNLPILSPGNFGFCTDTNEMFIGTSVGNKLYAIADKEITRVSFTTGWNGNTFELSYPEESKEEIEEKIAKHAGNFFKALQFGNANVKIKFRDATLSQSDFEIINDPQNYNIFYEHLLNNADSNILRKEETSNPSFFNYFFEEKIFYNVQLSNYNYNETTEEYESLYGQSIFGFGSLTFALKKTTPLGTLIGKKNINNFEAASSYEKQTFEIILNDELTYVDFYSSIDFDSLEFDPINDRIEFTLEYKNLKLVESEENLTNVFNIPTRVNLGITSFDYNRDQQHFPRKTIAINYNLVAQNITFKTPIEIVALIKNSNKNQSSSFTIDYNTTATTHIYSIAQITLPANSLDIVNREFKFIKMGTGIVQFVAENGNVTIRAKNNGRYISPQYGVVTATCLYASSTTSTWLLEGDITVS